MSNFARSLVISFFAGALVAAIVLYFYLHENNLLPEALCFSPPSQRVQVSDVPTLGNDRLKWIIKDTKNRLEKEAEIELVDQLGAPVNNAEIEVSFDMPSMPMMHSIPKAIAQPLKGPGQYVIKFKLDMAGVWVAKIEVKQPQRFLINKRFEVQ